MVKIRSRVSPFASKRGLAPWLTASRTSSRAGRLPPLAFTATLIAATGQYLQPDLMPGFVIYGVLASILAQLWLIALAVVMLRRASSAPVSG